MIWHIILFLYFIGGVFIGYRTHRLRNLLKMRAMEKRVMILQRHYDETIEVLKNLKEEYDTLAEKK
jgi:uncharacterized membrane-anchored protein YhcB (DUF1043 family)